MVPLDILFDNTLANGDFQKSSSFQERESELAQIRNRFQKGNNMWKNKDEVEVTNKTVDTKVGQQASDTHMTKMLDISQIKCFNGINNNTFLNVLYRDSFTSL